MVIFESPEFDHLKIAPSRSVKLVPFPHQVGGHAGLMTLDKQTICKPQNSQEQTFYQTLPGKLEAYVPRYKGVADVYVQQQGDGYLDVIAYPSLVCPKDEESHSKREGESDEMKNKRRNSRTRDTRYGTNYRVRLSSCGSLSIDQDSDGDDLFEEVSLESSIRRFGCNPWSMHCHRRQVAKMHCGQDEAKCHKFLLLENVTHKYKYPCVLDLKMGVRSYGDDQSEEKKKAHMEKVSASTSGKLGIRICGMQVFQMDKARFHCKNKYFGRRLSEEGLKTALKLFLFNGYHLRLELIEDFMARVKQLLDTLSDLESYRFFGSSLLLIYEGTDQDIGMRDVAEEDSDSEDDDCCCSHCGSHCGTAENNHLPLTKAHHQSYSEEVNSVEKNCPLWGRVKDSLNLTKSLDDRGYISEDDSGCGKSSCDMFSDCESDLWLESSDPDSDRSDRGTSTGWISEETEGYTEADYMYNRTDIVLSDSETQANLGRSKTEKDDFVSVSKSVPNDRHTPVNCSEANFVQYNSKCRFHAAQNDLEGRHHKNSTHDNSCKNAHLKNHTKNSTSANWSKSAGHQRSNTPSVDLKMIDFAHAQFKTNGSGDAGYQGSDMGYIYGLQNLLGIFKEIYEEHKHDLGTHNYSELRHGL